MDDLNENAGFVINQTVSADSEFSSEDVQVPTTRNQVAEALMDGDRLEDLDCFYNPETSDSYRYRFSGTSAPEMIHCRGDELPTREYHAGYGGVEGEAVICFSRRFVYFRYAYDGNESIVSVPRHPEFVTAGVTIGG